MTGTDVEWLTGGLAAFSVCDELGRTGGGASGCADGLKCVCARVLSMADVDASGPVGTSGDVGTSSQRAEWILFDFW